MRTRAIVYLVLPLLAISSESASALDYEKDIVPLLKENCYECHSDEKGKTKGNLVLDDIAEMKKYQITPFSLIQPGNPGESQFVDLMKLPAGDSDAMPPKGERMSKDNIKVIEQWIAEGATIDGLTRNLEGKDVQMSGATTEAADKDKGGADTAQNAAYLLWKNTEGREIEARFLRLDADKVTLVMRDGKSYPYPLAKLSVESQAQARKLAQAPKLAKNSERDKSEREDDEREDDDEREEDE
jgi:hypothetical protein